MMQKILPLLNKSFFLSCPVDSTKIEDYRIGYETFWVRPLRPHHCAFILTIANWLIMGEHDECIERATVIMKTFKQKRVEYNPQGGVPEKVFNDAITQADSIVNKYVKEWMQKAIAASKITDPLSENVLHETVKGYENALPSREECPPEILGLVMKLYKLCVWETMQHGPTTENDYNVDGRFIPGTDSHRMYK